MVFTFIVGEFANAYDIPEYFNNRYHYYSFAPIDLAWINPIPVRIKAECLMSALDELQYIYRCKVIENAYLSAKLID